MEPISSLYSSIRTPRKIVITTHQKPDADAMGSSLALFHYLEKLGHQVTVISPTNWAPWIGWMGGVEKVLNYEQQTFHYQFLNHKPQDQN